MRHLRLFITLFSIALFSACGTKGDTTTENPETEKMTTPVFQNKGHELVYKMAQVTGDYQDLLNLKDVVYQYTYRTPDGKEDVSIETYLFDGELSHGLYSKHERTLADLEGDMEQAYNSEDFWLKINGIENTDEAGIESVTFTRKTNFYWFTMMQKLLDPDINYEYLGQDSLAGNSYDVVKITFGGPEDIATDTYQLYINPSTHLVDQFLFTVVSKNVTDPILMQVTYDDFDGVKIPSYRKYTKSDWEANVIADVWVEEISEHIKFNQGVEKSLFNK
jgi:hypothetical protein